MRTSCCVMCRGCRCARDVADVGGVWAPGSCLGADGAAAVAGALSKLVNLTSLYLECTWDVEWVVSCVCVVCCVCVLCLSWQECRVCMCRIVSCAVSVVGHGLWLMLGVCGDQAMSWVPRAQPQWRVRCASW